MDEYNKNRGRALALNMLNRYYYDSDKPNIIMEIHHGQNMSKLQIRDWCNYYTNFWNSLNKSTQVVTTPTVCHSYGDFYVFFTKIRRDLV